MASSSESQTWHEIRRVPVPTRPITVLTSAPGPAVISESTAGRSAHVPPQGPHLLNINGLIPIITTLPQQSAQFQSRSQSHINPYLQQPQARGPTIALSPQMEEDLKAAVMGTMASTQPLPSQHPSKAHAKELRVNKWLRYISVVLCVALVVAEAIVAVVEFPGSDTVYGIPWGTLLGLWDVWRLIQSRKKRGGEPVSTWQVVGEGIFMTVTISLTGLVAASSTNQYKPDDDRIRGWVLAFVFLVLAILHLTLFIRTCAEKWSRPNSQPMELPMYHDPQQQHQLPQFIVQYVHDCPNCGSKLQLQPGEDLNTYMANKGDAQPQGVAPAYLR
ncbi:hypothetical protein F5X99DRAFT_388841 [Biscogniauxia marginata]|nr:hypothetical protein F5X99DRAFT_388841 [Biscogniauxia marginata]